MKTSHLRALGMPPATPKEWLDSLSHSRYLDYDIDSYSQGELVELLESRVAKILGKPAALFFSKGMVAQFAALKAIQSQTGTDGVILHPLSHIVWDEDHAVESLINLQPSFPNNHRTPFTIEDLTEDHTRAASMVIELPLRRAGFLLPEWDEIASLRQWCHEHGVHLHMDGARLWESTHFYKHNEAQISRLFDSVYVSLYKGLGGLGGAILAGETDFIEQCKSWRHRLGGNHYTLFPFLVSALEGLDKNLPLIPEWVERAISLAKRLGDLPKIQVAKPQTNGFVIFLEGDKEQLNSSAAALNEKLGLLLFRQVTNYPNSQRLMVEIQVGPQHALISDQEIVNYFKQWLD